MTLVFGSTTLLADPKSEMRTWTSRASGSSFPGFYPLGFSKEGWFAYTGHSDGDEPPALFSLTNIRCEGGQECVSDTPSSKEDLCYCPTVRGMKDLSRFGIRPLPPLKHGSFPAKISDREYEIQLVEQKELIPSEALPASFHPGVEVILVSKGQGKKTIDAFDYNHSGALAGSLRVAGWMATPDRDRILVIMGYKIAEAQQSLYPISVDLKSGFKK